VLEKFRARGFLSNRGRVPTLALSYRGIDPSLTHRSVAPTTSQCVSAGQLPRHGNGSHSPVDRLHVNPGLQMVRHSPLALRIALTATAVAVFTAAVERAPDDAAQPTKSALTKRINFRCMAQP
jgi:hypothetical protein